MFAGCPQQPSGRHSLSEEHVRHLAVQYRDEWLTRNPSAEASVLARGKIQSAERTTDAWHVVFITQTGHDRSSPEGMHDYYLHVYVKHSGELDRIERGPDVLS